MPYLVNKYSMPCISFKGRTHFEMRCRKKPGSILQIKKSECKLLKLTHILKGLDSGTSVKIHQKENYLLITNNPVIRIKHLMKMGAVLHC